MIDPTTVNRFETLLRQLHDAIKPHVDGRYLGTSALVPRTVRRQLSSLAAAGTAAESISPIEMSGRTFTVLSVGTHASAAIEVCFNTPASDNTSPTTGEGTTSGWFVVGPGTTVQLPGGVPFRNFRLRRATGTPSSTDPVIVAIDFSPNDTFSEMPRSGNVSSGGALDVLTKAVRHSDGQEGYLEGADGSAAARVVLAIAGWTGAAYARLASSAAGRLLVNLIAGQDGVAGGAGAAGATVLRTVTASDSPDVSSLASIETDAALIAADADTIAGWDDGAGRADVNPIAGQSGVAGGVGDPGATTVRVVGASTPSSSSTQATAGSAASDAVAANANRKSLIVRNRNTTDGDGVYVRVGSDATTNAFLLPPNREMTITARGRVSVLRQTNDVTLDLYEESNA